MTRFLWVLLASLYCTQFIGQGFFMFAFVAIMRESGMPLEQLSLIYAAGIIWGLKFLWAPLIDKFSFPLQGHYRGWLLVMQSAMVVILLIIGTIDVSIHFYAVIGMCLIHAFFSSTQDIAADALAFSLLTPAERGLGSTLQSVGGLVGFMLGGGGVLLLYPHLGWLGCCFILAGCTSISLGMLLFFREPKGEKVGVQAMPFRRLFLFWAQGRRYRWVTVILLCACSIGFVYALLTPLLVDKGWDIDRIGLVMNIGGAVVGILASFLAGRLIRLFSRKVALLCILFLQASGVAASFLLLTDGRTFLELYILLGFFSLSYAPVMVMFTTLMMDHASPQSPATDMTVQLCLYALAGHVAASLGCLLAGMYSYFAVLVLALALSVGAMLMALRMHFPVNNLQEEYGADEGRLGFDTE